MFCGFLWLSPRDAMPRTGSIPHIKLIVRPAVNRFICCRAGRVRAVFRRHRSGLHERAAGTPLRAASLPESHILSCPAPPAATRGMRHKIYERIEEAHRGWRKLKSNGMIGSKRRNPAPREWLQACASSKQDLVSVALSCKVYNRAPRPRA